MFRCQDEKCGLRRKMMGRPKRPVMSPAEAAGKFGFNTGTSLLEASRQAPLALVFLRHFGCTFTRQLLRQLEQVEQDARKHGARLVLVHMLQEGGEQRYLSGHDGIERIADPKCDLYRAFGLGNGGFWELFGPRVWWLGMMSVIQGCGVGRLAGKGMQMPGAFLFHHGEIISAQRAATAADLPDLPRLFEAAPSQ